jgi:hypothetical protein
LLGLRAVSDPDVIGLYKDVADPSREFGRKIRTVIRGMTTVAKKPETLNPFRYGTLAFQLISHKLMRWAVPWFGLVYIAGALSWWSHDWLGYVAIAPAAAVIAVYLTAAVLPGLKGISAFSAPYYFVEANLAVLVAGVQFAAGRRITTWVPSER